MGFSGGGSNITKPHTHDSNIVQDGGSLAANVTQFGLTAGSILYSDGANIQELAVGSASDTLTVNGAATAPEWAAGSGSAAFTPLGNDVQTSAVSSLTVTGMTGHDVYQVIYSICDEATGSPQNCAPRMRISNGGSNYNNTYALITAPHNISNADEWKLNTISNRESYSGVFYIYAPNSSFTNGYDGTMIQGHGATTAGQISTLFGNNDNTADITSVEIFFMQNDGTMIDLKGSLQVNGMNYS